MCWTHLVFLSILSVSRSQGLDDGCALRNYCEFHCQGISQKELLLPDNLNNKSGDNEFPYHDLIIVDSIFRYIEGLPTLTRNCHKFSYYRNLTIRNSSIVKIEAEALKNWPHLNTLDLSYNEIKETSFLSPVEVVTNLDLSHNKIEYFDGNIFEKSSTNRFIQLIDMSFNEISNVSSYKYVNAKSLNLSHNHLTDLENLLINFKELESVDLSYNQLRKLSKNNFPSKLYLNYLNVDHNKLISIDSQIFKFLRYNFNTDFSTGPAFIFSNNLLKNINIFLNDSPEFDSINSLDYSNNSLQAINFKRSLFSLCKINSLKLVKNKISDLSRFNFTDTNIDFLDLSDNNLTYVDLKSFGDIRQSLDLSHNKIMYINSSNFNSMYLSKLNLSHNEIEILNRSTFSAISSLQVLDLSHCILKHLDKESFSNLSNLNSLNLSFNFIELLPEKLFESLRLKNLDLSHNFLTILPGNIFSGLNLELIDVGFNQFSRFFENTFYNSSIKNLIAKGNPLMQINEMDLIGLRDLVSIDLSNTGIKKLSSSTFKELKNLICICLNDNEIESIPAYFLKGKKNLVSFSMTGNNVTDLDPDAFSGQLKLRTLNITLKGKLSQGVFRDLFNLEELNFLKSEITTIENGSFRGLDLLRKLNFENLKPINIETGAFIGLSSLKTFNASRWFPTMRTVEEYQFKGLEELSRLNLSSIGLKTVKNNAFVGLFSLESLDLSFNSIEKVETNAFNRLKLLSTLDLSRNKLDFIQIGLFRHLINLTNLYLNHNSIDNIPFGVFTNLNQLKVLNLSNNQLHAVRSYELFPLKKLELLDVNFNKIKGIDNNFKNMTALKTIGIGSNELNCHFLIDILNSFQQRNISYQEISNLEFYQTNIDGVKCV